MSRTLTTLFGVLLVALCLGFAACGGGDDDEEAAPQETTAATTPAAEQELNTEDIGPTKDVIPDGDDVEVAFFTVAGNTYLEASLEEMRKVADEHGAEITLFDSAFDPAKQFNQVQDATATQRFDAFIIVALDTAGIVPAIEDALEAGIKVVATDTPIGPDLTTTDIQVEGVSGSIVRPASLVAEDHAEIIKQTCEGKDECVAVWIPGVLATVFDQAQKKVFDQLAKDNPSIEFIVGPEGGYVTEPAFRAMQDILQANPKIDIVVSADQMIQGAEQAIDDAGRGDEGIVLVGGGGSTPAVTAVREGRWYATPTFVPRDEGREAMEMAIIAARDGTIESPGRFSLDYTELPRTITQDNKAEWEGFEGQWAG
jgi:ribose transport system substrate-binding protein